jgi:hypothetical protein
MKEPPDGRLNEHVGGHVSYEIMMMAANEYVISLH